jgi:Helicase HerA, central domain
MSIWSWLKLTAVLWLLGKAVKIVGWMLLFAAVIAAWPLTLVTAAGYGMAWWRGWPPARLRRAAAWALTGSGACLLAAAMRRAALRAAPLAAARDWQHSWPDPAALAARDWGHIWPYPAALAAARTFVLLPPVAIPAGLGLAALLWAWRNYAVTTGLGGITASAPITFDARQWRRQVRTARDLTEAPGAVPLVARGGKIPVGGTIRAVGRRWDPVFALEAKACARHMVIVGATGSGKTNLMIRLWAGWFTATLDAARAGRGSRPLLVVLDCKGGRDARRKADRTRRLLYGAGARRVVVWPDEAPLSLWDLPPQDLAVLLYQMIDTGTGNAAYYADVMQAVLTMAVTAPGGPPLNAASFTDRLDAKWLARAWNDGRHRREAALVHAAARHLPDIQLRFATLLDRLGPPLDGPGTLADADAWYFILEGTSEPSVAQAQAMALTELAAHAATNPFGEPRAMLLAADDYSAVSGRVPLSNLYERGRSLGIGVQVSAQSWPGLGATEDERYRIAATADGGIWVMQTPYPEPLTALAGKRRVLETAHKLVGNSWGDEGTTREQRAWTADPDLIRRLDIGQACYIHHGAASFVQVARPKPSPLTLIPPPAPEPPPVQLPVPRQEPAPGSWPPPAEVNLDDIFGPGAAR